jgi:hypothetical protein
LSDDAINPDTECALAHLEASLRDALRHRGIDDRKAAGDALRAVLEFIYTQPRLTRQGCHYPLFDLLAALDDLNQGRIAPMLHAKFFGNRPPEGARFQQAKAFALFAIEQLVDQGETKTSACQKVAEVWNRAVPDYSRSAETIRSWNTRLSRLPSDAYVRVALTALRQAGEADPRVRDADILATLSGVLRDTTAALGKNPPS